MNLPQLLQHADPFVRRYARGRLLRPGSAEVRAAVASAFAEPDDTCETLLSWLHHVALPSDLLPLLDLVDLTRGSPNEGVFVGQVALFGGPEVVAWAKMAFQTPGLAETLRAEVVCILLRRAPEVTLDLPQETLDAALRPYGMMEAVVQAALSGWGPVEPILDLLHHPLLQDSAVHAVCGNLVERSEITTADLGVPDVRQLQGILFEGRDDSSAVFKAAAPSFAMARQGSASAWTAFGNALRPFISAIPEVGTVSGGTRRKAVVVRALLASPPPRAQAAALAAAVLAAVADLALVGDDDAIFEHGSPSVDALLEVNARPLPEAHPWLADALASHGPDVVPLLVAQLDVDHYHRSHHSLQALLKLAWHHPGCLDTATETLMALEQADPGDLLAEDVSRLLSQLTEAAVPAIVSELERPGRTYQYGLAGTLGELGGPEAKAWLLGQSHRAVYDDSGIAQGLLQLGSPEAIEPLATAFRDDAVGDLALTLLALCEVTGHDHPDRQRWEDCIQAEAAERAAYRDEFNQLMAQLQEQQRQAKELEPTGRAERRANKGASKTKRSARAMPRRKKGKKKSKR
jgi:hypothetical protein